MITDSLKKELWGYTIEDLELLRDLISIIIKGKEEDTFIKKRGPIEKKGGQ